MVIVADDRDYAADMVARHLRRATFVRLDPGRPRSEEHTSALIRAGATSEWTVGGAPVGPWTSVLWRKPTKATSLEGEEAWAADETTVAVLGTLRAAGAGRWMNEPMAVHYHRTRLPQLTLAADLSMDIPDTLTTTNPEEAAAFIAAGRTVVKAMTQTYVDFAPAWEITPSDPLIGMQPVPHTFQRLIDKKADLRVTVVGDQVFAARITSDLLDWRADPEAASYELVELDDVTNRQLHDYMAAASLSFGAFDLVEDMDGRPWFLECNSNGEWGFIEESTGAPISGAIAEWLTLDA
ncbi:hypothetical protein [Kitasatospora sp. NPDC096204]|uniref:hypothetical protein n=1 Tax=Kitasatospora sp. NPDC096204 TaxID=3364094 RepID=UPI003815D82F